MVIIRWEGQYIPCDAPFHRHRVSNMHEAIHLMEHKMTFMIKHTCAKGYLRVEGFCKKLCNEMFVDHALSFTFALLSGFLHKR